MSDPCINWREHDGDGICGHPEDEHDDDDACLLCTCVLYRTEGDEPRPDSGGTSPGYIREMRETRHPL